MSPETEDKIEAAYWNMDARIKGYGQWTGMPQTERDAFKWEVRGLLSNYKEIKPSNLATVRDYLKKRDQAFEEIFAGYQYGEEETRDAKAWFNTGWHQATDAYKLPDDLAQAICRVARDKGFGLSITLVHEMLEKAKS